MRIRNFSHLFFASLVIAVFVLASCQKEVDIDLENPPPVPSEVQDSTLLIKSIKINSLDPVSGLPDGGDTIKEDYFYDTVNRKIIMTLDQVASSQYLTGAGVEHTYDANGLLTNVLYKYKNGYIPEGDDRISVRLSYDADKIIQKITLYYFNGNTRSTLFRKTLLSENKYRLDWGEPTIIAIGGARDTVSASAVFDKAGKCLTSEYSYSYNTVIGGGEDAYTKIIYRDSLVYDANGSVTKVVENYIDTLNHENITFVACEFTARHTKGDQLFNMRQILLNGIANIPFGEDMFHGSITGVLSFFPDGYEPLEYSKYPFQFAKVFNSQTNQYDNFTAISELDNKDRLIKFRGFLNDVELIPYQYEISYYK
ncbi:hypothetical protein [Terrimonas pollutisoli]|uniref:hypothetical protein n=1 Tax=Terrimonas pollutisoli TaxID=3034147 RepID=UPI0023ECF34A|nr:hypothetical protein [Terrimonas sp. H1YJ31]